MRDQSSSKPSSEPSLTLHDMYPYTNVDTKLLSSQKEKLSAEIEKYKSKRGLLINELLHLSDNESPVNENYHIIKVIIPMLKALTIDLDDVDCKRGINFNRLPKYVQDKLLNYENTKEKEDIFFGSGVSFKNNSSQLPLCLEVFHQMFNHFIYPNQAFMITRLFAVRFLSFNFVLEKQLSGNYNKAACEQQLHFIRDECKKIDADIDKQIKEADDKFKSSMTSNKKVSATSAIPSASHDDESYSLHPFAVFYIKEYFLHWLKPQLYKKHPSFFSDYKSIKQTLEPYKTFSEDIKQIILSFIYNDPTEKKQHPNMLGGFFHVHCLHHQIISKFTLDKKLDRLKNLLLSRVQKELDENIALTPTTKIEDIEKMAQETRWSITQKLLWHKIACFWTMLNYEDHPYGNQFVKSQFDPGSENHPMTTFKNWGCSDEEKNDYTEKHVENLELYKKHNDELLAALATLIHEDKVKARVDHSSFQTYSDLIQTKDAYLSKCNEKDALKSGHAGMLNLHYAIQHLRSELPAMDEHFFIQSVESHNNFRAGLHELQERSRQGYR